MRQVNSPGGTSSDTVVERAHGRIAAPEHLGHGRQPDRVPLPPTGGAARRSATVTELTCLTMATN
jgi:hypothetical protein